MEPWQLDFRVTAEAQPEPDYAVYISRKPVPIVDGCLVTDKLLTGEMFAVEKFHLAPVVQYQRDLLHIHRPHLGNQTAGLFV